jgi:hypothetical protein
MQLTLTKSSKRYSKNRAKVDYLNQGPTKGPTTFSPDHSPHFGLNPMSDLIGYPGLNVVEGRPGRRRGDRHAA